MNNYNIRVNKVPEFIADFLRWAACARRVLNPTPLIPSVCYRGHACSAWKLLPKLCRDRTTLQTDILKQYEKEIVSEFRSRFSLNGWTDMEMMAYAQHHGAPTRLLDWSLNPLVGLWFAISADHLDQEDGVVYQLSLMPKSKVVTAMTEPPGDVFKAGGDFKSSLKMPVHVFSSPACIQRGDRQSSVFSFAQFKGNFAVQPLETILEHEQPQCLRPFRVPALLKPELRRLLANLGLDAYSLFGGPDALGKSIMARL